MPNFKFFWTLNEKIFVISENRQKSAEKNSIWLHQLMFEQPTMGFSTYNGGVNYDRNKYIDPTEKYLGVLSNNVFNIGILYFWIHAVIQPNNCLSDNLHCRAICCHAIALSAMLHSIYLPNQPSSSFNVEIHAKRTRSIANALCVILYDLYFKICIFWHYLIIL